MATGARPAFPSRSPAATDAIGKIVAAAAGRAAPSRRRAAVPAKAAWLPPAARRIRFFRDRTTARLFAGFVAARGNPVRSGGRRIRRGRASLPVSRPKSSRGRRRGPADGRAAAGASGPGSVCDAPWRAAEGVRPVSRRIHGGAPTAGAANRMATRKRRGRTGCREGPGSGGSLADRSGPGGGRERRPAPRTGSAHAPGLARGPASPAGAGRAPPAGGEVARACAGSSGKRPARAVRRSGFALPGAGDGARAGLRPALCRKGSPPPGGCPHRRRAAVRVVEERLHWKGTGVPARHRIGSCPGAPKPDAVRGRRSVFGFRAFRSRGSGESRNCRFRALDA